jgi:hypothetical protein
MKCGENERHQYQPTTEWLNLIFKYLFAPFNPDKPGWICRVACLTGFYPVLFTFNPDKPDFLQPLLQAIVPISLLGRPTRFYRVQCE